MIVLLFCFPPLFGGFFLPVTIFFQDLVLHNCPRCSGVSHHGCSAEGVAAFIQSSFSTGNQIAYEVYENLEEQWKGYPCKVCGTKRENLQAFISENSFT